ncbi:hypothetical protein [Burkholderia stagnalis]|nr:hypothetical protein [Burkholderia stagnalis]MDY7805446.1 hypothetical protein [Burkholderia stagnalis]VWB50440.1 hypothetical protein BST28156_02336 [Burkholderia stagnalis]
MKHILYGIYALIVVTLFSCSPSGGGGGGGTSGWGSSSARSGYSSYGSHK